MPVALTTRVAIALLLLTVAAWLSFRSTYEPDLFWHLAQGREIASWHLVDTNFFSSTYPDYRQPSTSWLFDFGVYALWQAGGAAAVQLAQTFVIALALAVILYAARLRASLPTALAVVAFGIFVIEPRALPRPHTISLAGVAACALLVEAARSRRSASVLLWAAPIVALWSNLHVESFFGVALLGIFAACEYARPASLAKRQALLAGAAVVLAAAATLINPYGTGLLRYLWENAAVPSVIRIAELQPAYLPNYAAFFVYLIGAGGLLVLRRRALSLWEPVVFGVFALLALRHLRFVALFYCATAPLVAAHLEALVAAQPASTGRRKAAGLVALGFGVGLLVARLPPSSFLEQLGAGQEFLVPPGMFPVGAMEFSRKAGLRGPVFNSNNIGGYMIWAGYPDVRVFQDSRLQAYPADHFRSIMDAYRSQPSWDLLVDAVDWAVLSRPRPNELSGAGRFPRDRWATVYWDEASEVLVRRSGAFADVASAYEYKDFVPESDPFAMFGPERAIRVVAEARRNMAENPSGLSAPVVLCVHGDGEACAQADRLATERPDARSLAARLRRLSQGGG